MDPLSVPPEGAEWMSAYHHRLGWLVWKSLHVEKSQKALPPQIRALEGAAAAVHRAPVPQAVWPGAASGRHSSGELGAVGGCAESGADCPGSEDPR